MKKALFAVAFTLAASTSRADLIDVYALTHSFNSGSGTGVSSISLTAGELFTVSVDPNDLWNAGSLPRWSNADGLTKDLYATGTDESGEAAGTLIGTNFGLFTFGGHSAAYGSLVGRVGGQYITLGTSFFGASPGTGTLQLFYWDSFTPDNSEQVKVAVNVNTVPEASSVTLLAAGLLGLAAWSKRRAAGQRA